MYKLPEEVNWPLLAAYMLPGNRTAAAIARQAGSNSSSFYDLLDGKVTNPNFAKALGILGLASEIVSQERFLECTKLTEVPTVPVSVNFLTLIPAIKKSYPKGRTQLLLTEATGMHYKTINGYSSGKIIPRWDNGAHLYNIGVRNLTEEELLQHIDLRAVLPELLTRS